jgi:hypothetical protein
MILDIGIPQLVLNDEGHGIGGKSGSLRLRHVGRSCWDFRKPIEGERPSQEFFSSDARNPKTSV